MPTFRKILEEFIEQSRHGDRTDSKRLFFGEEKYSLALQEDLDKILHRNIIKTTKKESLN